MEKSDEKKNILDELNNAIKSIRDDFPKLLSLKENFTLRDVKKQFRSKLFESNDIIKVKLCLAYAYYNLKIIDGKTEFLEFNSNFFIYMNDLKGMKEQFENRKMNFKDDYNRSMLYTACRCGFKEIVQFLLEKGADPNLPQINGSSSLHAASFYGHIDIVKLLLEVGSFSNIKNDFQNTPTEEAMSEDIVTLINKYQNDKGYNFFVKNRQYFSNIKLVFDSNNNFVGKRCLITGSTSPEQWDLAWHGTKIASIPSILQHGLKKVGEKIGEKEIDVRKDTARISRDAHFREKTDWAEAIFTSCSIYYASTTAYAEHFNDCNGVKWFLILECRLMPNSYEKSTHTFYEYILSKNEDSLVENRSADSSKVNVVAVWYLKKSFVRDMQDHALILDTLNKYIEDC
jgi:hypothetical protein